MNKGTCSGCGAEIVWIKTAAGKTMPCDPMPKRYWQKDKASGKVVTVRGNVISCEFEGDPDTMSGLGYISHFSTCPKAGEFRRKKGLH